MATRSVRFSVSNTGVARMSIAAAVIIVVLGSALTAGAREPLKLRGAQVIGGPVTPTAMDIDIRDLPRSPAWQPGDPIKEIPRRFYPAGGEIMTPHESNPDPLADLQRATAMRTTDAFTTPILNQGGQGFTGATPPDTVGDIGPNHYIQAVNSNDGALFQIFDKNGNSLAGPTTMDSLGGGSCASGFGDPIILYDGLADRWLMQEFSTVGDFMCFYISQGPNPVTDGWYHYGFQSPGFPDYPHFGVWPDAYYGTTNESPPAVYAFDRVSMLAGDPATSQRFTLADLAGYNFQGGTPADLDGADAPPVGSPGIIMRHVDEEAHSNYPTNNPATDLLEIFAFSVDWATPANSTFDQLPDLVITDFNSKFISYTTVYSVPQPGTTDRLDPIREFILNRLQYRNFGSHESLIGVLPTNLEPTDTSDVNAALRWFELRRTTGDWIVFQEGTFAPGDADENRFVGSIAMDQSGNIAMGYSITDIGSPSTAPSLRYTGRLEGDALGVMTQTETQQVTGSGTGSGRWGDYASINVDPEDDCTFWFTSEYQYGTEWATQITSFRVANCGCDVSIDPLVVSASPTAPNLVTVSWNDSAEPTVAEYQVGRSRDAGGPFEVVATTTDSSPGMGGGAGYLFDDPDVSGGTIYHYTVQASDGGVCLSELSNVASATATGACTLPPVFAGVVSVTDPQSAACALDLSWNTGAHECGSSLVYNVYRSTASGFTPDPTNLVVSCIDATSLVDTTVAGGVTYHYIVRAEDDSGNGAGLCAGGNEDGNTAEASGTATGPEAVFFADDMETGEGNWTHGGSGDTWALSTTRAHSGATSFHAVNADSVTDQRLESFEIPLPAVLGITLEFWSWQEVEASLDGCYDGAIIEASTDGGSSWSQLPDARMLTLPYDGEVETGDTNPIAGQEAWCGDPRDWTRTVVDLSDYAGSNVKLRFRLATDSISGREGWYIDDVKVSSPADCLDIFTVFHDGFESGDTTMWSSWQ
jgi:Immune inhibitor A-like, MAM domain